MAENEEGEMVCVFGWDRRWGERKGAYIGEV